MIRTLILTLLTSVAALPAPVSAVVLDFTPVGNAGNAADPETGIGAVSYNYAISTTEVTNAQYTEFLNSVDPTGANTLALYNPSMAGNLGGIELQTGNSDGSKFVAQAGREQQPVTFVSFFDAMRFTNWLHNGQGSGDTESGAYTLGNGVDEVRSPDARYWIPSEDEWYKAAYHDVSSVLAGVYFDYANGSDSVPVSDQPGDNPAAVNYSNDDGVANGFNDGFAVSGSTSFPTTTSPFTDVGAYTAAASPYGTFDQNGNVFEWNEAVSSLPGRVTRGGSWNTGGPNALTAAFSTASNPAFEDGILGFRVATVPEPSALLIGTLAACGLLMRKRR